MHSAFQEWRTRDPGEWYTLGSGRELDDVLEIEQIIDKLDRIDVDHPAM